MDVLILVLVLLAGAAYVAQPLYTPPSSPGPSHHGQLEARREALFQILRDLDQDRRSGLVDEAEYARQRYEVEGEAAAVIRSLDLTRGPRADGKSD